MNAIVESLKIMERATRPKQNLNANKAHWNNVRIALKEKTGTAHCPWCGSNILMLALPSASALQTYQIGEWFEEAGPYQCDEGHLFRVTLDFDDELIIL